MATTFQQLWSELLGDVPHLPQPRAVICVQSAWRSIRDSRRWSFTVAEAVLNCPQIITAGAVTVTQYSPTVTGNSAAQTAWQATGFAVPLVGRQLRLSFGPLYTIIQYDGVNTLTLDRPFAEASAASSGYQIYKAYYSAPTQIDSNNLTANNFLRWVSIIDPINGYRFVDVTLSKRNLDSRDPLRGAIYMPYYMAWYKDDLNGVPQYEMWPHPTQNLGYLALYQTFGQELLNPNDTLPSVISRQLVMEKARTEAYQWAEANKGAYAEMYRTNWIKLKLDAEERFKDRLILTELQDEEIYQTNFCRYDRPMYYLGPLTGAFLQAHDGVGLW